MWLDNEFPAILGAELHRPHPAYVAELACDPTVMHDFRAQPGETVALDRYRYWGNPGTKSSRERTQDQLVGTANGRGIVKEKVFVSLREYTGPADIEDPNAPSSLKVARQTLITAQRTLLSTRDLARFHQSVGSNTLLDDYRRWRDRVFMDELFKAEAQGKADSTQGGYYFPDNHTNTSGTVATYGSGEDAKFRPIRDLMPVVTDMRKRNIPAFPDGLFRAIIDPVAMRHMREDADFRAVTNETGQGLIDPRQPWLAPNASRFLGMSAAYGQVGSVAGQTVMPSGFPYEGVRFFESTNMPEKSFSTTINADVGGSGAGTYKAAPILFFGMQAVGVGVGGEDAQVLINNNDDYGRHISLIWSLLAGFEILNKDFVTVAYSFVY